MTAAHILRSLRHSIENSDEGADAVVLLFRIAGAQPVEDREFGGIDGDPMHFLYEQTGGASISAYSRTEPKAEVLALVDRAIAAAEEAGA